MLLERSQVVVGLVAAALIAAGTVFSVGLQTGTFTAGYPVRVELENAAGLTSGDDVLVAGVRAGRIIDVGVGDGVAVADLKTTADLPADTRAEVINKNPLGAEALLLVAGDDWDTSLEETGTIAVEDTSTPVGLPDLGNETVELLGESDTEALSRLITSLADITEGQREEVDEVLTGLRDLSRVVAADRDDLATLVDRAEEVVGTLAERDRDLVRIVDGFGSTVDELAARRGRIRRLLAEVRDSSRLTADLLEDEQARIDRVLTELDEILDLVDSHQVDLAHAVAYGGVAFDGFSSVGYRGEEDNPYWANILTSGIGPVGIDAIAGCGGAIDQILDQVFGPKPCPEDPGTGSAGGARRQGAALPAFLPLGDGRVGGGR